MLSNVFEHVRLRARAYLFLMALALGSLAVIPPFPVSFDRLSLDGPRFEAEFWPRFESERSAGEAWTRSPAAIALEIYALGSDFRREHAIVTQMPTGDGHWLVLVEERARTKVFCLEMYRVEITRIAGRLVPVRVLRRNDCNPVRWTLLYVLGALPSYFEDVGASGGGY